MAPTLDEETAKKVVRQVEFYFSDSNLPRDKFLRNTISESEDGFVSLALICSFSRMRKHLNLGDAKQEDINEETIKAVAETLRSSSSIKVSEDGKKVGRTSELSKPEEIIEQLDARTIAASPLEYDVKLEDLESFFGQLAKVSSVRLPSHVADKKLFCGTALIEFSTEEDAVKILERRLVYSGADLELKPKKDFDEERSKQAQKFEGYRAQNKSNLKNNSNPEDDYPKGLIVAFELRSIANPIVLAEVKEENDEEKMHEDVKEANNGENSSKSEEKLSRKSEEKLDVQVEVKDANNGEHVNDSDEKVDPITGSKPEAEEAEVMNVPSEGSVQNPEQLSGEVKETVALHKNNKDVVLREDVKAVCQKFGTVKFIDFKIGDKSGYIRFEHPEAAQKARAAAALAEEGGLVVKNFIATLDPVSGDAEREYWSRLRSNQDRFRENRGYNRGRGGRSGRGGGRFGGKHHRSRDHDSANRANKFQKVEAA